ncbi:unnamed protein product [Linum tenue]|nr:unnamed protein product [Linum tenue]
MSLLHHYEQLYFLRAQGWNAAASAAVPLQNPSTENQAAAQQHNRINVAAQLPGASGLPSIVGVIDGKFDSGYLVTVTIGNEKLQGVVYQAATEAQQQHYYGLSANNNNNNNETTESGVVRSKRRRKETRTRDPNQLLLSEAAGQHQQPEQQDVNMVVEPGRETRGWESPPDNESSSFDDEVDSDDDDDEDHAKNVASVAVAAGEDSVSREETRPVEGLGVLPS